jgi:rhodanese-related sulfurtransferase
MFNFLKNLFKSNYTSLNGASFRQQYENTPQAVLLDVRTPAEYKRGSIKGAKNINLHDAAFQQKIEQLDKSRTYFVFCAAGARSGAACNRMVSAGYQVFNLSGGINSWPNNSK